MAFLYSRVDAVECRASLGSIFFSYVCQIGSWGCFVISNYCQTFEFVDLNT